MTKKTTAHILVKRSLIAGAVLATAGLASAQSNVTIYGRIDTGVEYQDKVATAGGDSSRTSLANGGILPSIWGFKGNEDLGGGLKAVFNLEGDFDGSTGGTRFGGGLQLFGRQANVGLSGGFGTVLLGRQYSPAILADLGTDPRGFKESFSALLPYALTQNPATNGVTGNNFLGIFNGNMISYSNAFGPVNLGVGYGFGEVAGEFSRGSTVAVGVSYTGPITVSGSYQKIEGLGVAAGADQDESKRFSLGVAIPFGAFTAKAYYAKAETDSAAGAKVSDSDFFGVGVNWAWNPQNTLTAAYYQGKDKAPGFGGKTKDIVVSNDYALSKRTTLYAQLVRTDADALANTGLSIAADRGPIAGQKTNIVGAGIKHDF
ncbi:porin [Methylibium sp.]|uniref:porin n=1 Tax=Methylibium sp. TaxID=2067992 RepID=UPI003D12447B